MNSHYIKQLPFDELKQRLLPYLEKYDLTQLSEEQFNKMIEITREPLVLLSDITDAVEYFFGEEVNVDEAARETLDSDVSQDVLKDVLPLAESWEWTEENLHQKLEEFRGVWKEKGVKPKVTMWAVRAAVTGRTRGADMVGILEVIGKEKTINRIKSAIK